MSAKKIIPHRIALFLLLFSVNTIYFFSSCSNSPRFGRLGVGFSQDDLNGIAQKISARSPEDDYMGFTIEVTVSGSNITDKIQSATFSEEEFFTKMGALEDTHEESSQSGIEFQFDDLSTKETYSIKICVYEEMEREKLLRFKGAKDGIKLSTGEITSVSIRLTEAWDENDNPPYDETFYINIFLYNKTEDNYKIDSSIYMIDSQNFESVNTANLSSSKKFVDFTMIPDNDGTYYSTAYYTDGSYLYRNDSTQVTDINTGNSGYTPPSTDNLKLYGDSTGFVFYGGQVAGSISGTIAFFINGYNSDIDSNITINAAKLEIKNLLNPSWSLTNIFDFATNLEKSEGTDGIEYDGDLFIAFSYEYSSNKYIAFMKFDMSAYKTGSADSGEEWHISITDDASYVKMLSLDDVGDLLISSLTSNAKITDMTVQNGYLYALLRESANIEISNAGQTLYERGALIRIDTTNFDAASVSVKYDSPCINPEQIAVSTTEGRKFSVYQSASYLVGPRKIIAIAPKKLIIADDGKNFFYDDEKSQFCYKNINRIVVYDEESETSVSYSIPDAIYFDEESKNELAFTAWNGTCYCSNAD